MARIDADGVTRTTFVYDAGGDLAVEYTTSTAPAATGTEYLTADHLGCTRMVTDNQGHIEQHDYLPFGEEILGAVGGWRTGISTYGPNTIRQKFTGKERDVETGLDYFEARYFSSSQGRFTGPDPENVGAKPGSGSQAG